MGATVIRARGKIDCIFDWSADFAQIPCDASSFFSFFRSRYSQTDGAVFEIPQDLFNLDTFELTRVLQFGAPLLASAGTEYDASLGDLDARARLDRQKKELRTQLGLDDQERFAAVDFISTEDVTAQSSTARTSMRVDVMFDESHLSASDFLMLVFR